MRHRSGPLKLAMLLAALAAIGLGPATSARAQEAPPVYAPPATPRYQPPPYLLRVDPPELERRGRRKKVVGAVLMGVGIALTVAGVGLALDGAMHAQCAGHEEHAVCTPSFATSELELGTTGVLAGQIMTVVGIPVYIVGGREVDAARAFARVNVRF